MKTHPPGSCEIESSKKAIWWQIFPLFVSLPSIHLSANLKGFGCFLTLFQFKELAASSGCGGERTKYYLMIYAFISALLDSFSASDADGEEKLTSRERYVPNHHALAPYIFILCLPCARAHVAHGTTHSQPVQRNTDSK
jgi:hypothetical protein